MTKSRKTELSDAVGLLLFIVLSPLILFVITLHFLSSLALNLAIWCCWCSRGRNVLFVTSESPNWHDYIQKTILPRLENRVIVLNWSQHKSWRFSLAVLAFRHFGGSSDFNPLAIVFRPFKPARIFRFHQPFKQMKQGNKTAIPEMEKQLYSLL